MARGYDRHPLFVIGVDLNIDPAAAAVGTHDGDGVDTYLKCATVVGQFVVTDVGVGGTIAPRIEDSDDDGVGDAYAAVAGTELRNVDTNEIVTSPIAAVGKYQVISHQLHKRYVRCSADVAVDDVTFEAILIRTQPWEAYRDLAPPA